MAILLVTINPGLQILGTLPLGYLGIEYSATLTAAGGLPPYSLTVTSALPDLLTATDNGDGTLTISGGPTEEYNGTVSVVLTDAKKKRVRKVLPLVITPAFLLTEDSEFILTEDGFRIYMG